MTYVVRRTRLLLRVIPIVALIALSRCGDSTSPPKPAAIVEVTGQGFSAVVGQNVGPAPTFQVNDASGKLISGVAFTITASGGGTLALTPTKTASTPTSVGTWTLGTTAGTQTLTIAVAGVSPLTISALATAGPPASSSSGSGPQNASGTIGQVSVLQPSIKLLDSFGNPVSGIAVTVQVTGSGTVQNSAPVTNSAGIASVGTWTLGTVAGAQTVTLTAGGSVPAVSFTTSVSPGPAASVVASGSTSGSGSPSTTSPISPTIRLVDAFNNGVAGVPVTVTIGAQSGTVSVPNPVTDGNGFASAGVWTLGPLVGAQTVSMSAGGFGPIVFTVNTATPGAVVLVAGKFQVGPPNSALPVNPVIKVTTAAGIAIPGQTVQFTVTIGGGTVGTVSAVTDAQGQASPGVWTLGAIPGSQNLRATAGSSTLTIYATAVAPSGNTTYNLQVRYFGTPPSAGIQAAITAAASRVSQEITAHLSTLNLTGLDVGASCFGPAGPVLAESDNDNVLYVQVKPIDGVGGILGSTSACIIRLAGGLPIIGAMTLDDADANSLLANGTLMSVVLHEMHHALGYGTLWSGNQGFQQLLISGAGGANPFYLGAAGNAAYLANGGIQANGIPIENSGGSGTRDAHWREATFQTELLTGFLNGGVFNPLSLMSILALEDLGYAVNPAAADPFTLPVGAIRSADEVAAPGELREILLPPRFAIDDNGHLTPIVPLVRPDSGGPVKPSVKKQ